MAYIGFRLPDHLAACFEAVSLREGGKSRVLRSLVVETIGRASTAEFPPRSGRLSSKLTLRMCEEDLAALDRVAADAGMRRTEWAVACLRRRLIRRPQFNREQAEALLGARRELRRISDQVRELVRSVREGDVPAGELEHRLRALEALQRDARAELDAVQRAIKGEASYWAADSD